VQAERGICVPSFSPLKSQQPGSQPPARAPPAATRRSRREDHSLLEEAPERGDAGGSHPQSWRDETHPKHGD